MPTATFTIQDTLDDGTWAYSTGGNNAGANNTTAVVNSGLDGLTLTVEIAAFRFVLDQGGTPIPRNAKIISASFQVTSDQADTGHVFLLDKRNIARTNFIDTNTTPGTTYSPLVVGLTAAGRFSTVNGTSTYSDPDGALARALQEHVRQTDYGTGGSDTYGVGLYVMKQDISSKGNLLVFTNQTAQLTITWEESATAGSSGGIGLGDAGRIGTSTTTHDSGTGGATNDFARDADTVGAPETITDLLTVTVVPSTGNANRVDPGFWFPANMRAQGSTSPTARSNTNNTVHEFRIRVDTTTNPEATARANTDADWTLGTEVTTFTLCFPEKTTTAKVPIQMRLPTTDGVTFFRVKIEMIDPDNSADVINIRRRFYRTSLVSTHAIDAGTGASGVLPSRAAAPSTTTVSLTSGEVKYEGGAHPGDWGAGGTQALQLRDEDDTVISSSAPAVAAATGIFTGSFALPEAATFGTWDVRSSHARTIDAGNTVVPFDVKLIAAAMAVTGFDGDDNSRSFVDDSVNGNRFNRGAPIRVDVAWFNDSKNRSTATATVAFGDTGTLNLSTDDVQGAHTGNGQSLNETFTAGTKSPTIGGTVLGITTVGGVLGLALPTIVGSVDRILAFHMQTNDNVLVPSKDVDTLLSSDLAFLSVKVMNVRGEAVVGAKIDHQVKDQGGLINPVALGTGVLTSTVNGNRGYTALNSLWDKTKPGGGWYYQARLAASDGGAPYSPENRGNGPTTYSTDGTNNALVTLLAPNPALRLIVAGGAYGEAADQDHWHPGDPLLVGLALIDFVTGKLVLPDTGSASVMIGRFRQSLGRAEYLDSDLTWKQITTTSAAYNWPLAPSAGDPNVFVAVFADTTGFSVEDLHLVGKCTLNATPYSGPSKVETVTGDNPHAGYSIDPIALALGGIISTR